MIEQSKDGAKPKNHLPTNKLTRLFMNIKTVIMVSEKISGISNNKITKFILMQRDQNRVQQP